MKTKILIVDDHPVLRKGLCALLEEENDMKVIAEAEGGLKALELARKLLPDVVIMDITMPDLDGIQTTRNILSEYPRTKVIALSIHSSKSFIENMLSAGASGYIPKECIPEELITGIRTVMQDKVYLSPSIERILLSEYVNLLSRNDLEEKQLQHYNNKNEFSNFDSIILSKLHPPSITPDIIPRLHLLEKLDKSVSIPFTLISAAAGYGKSTLASSWLEKGKYPSAWLSLDEEDNNFYSFTAYLVTALRSLFPLSCSNTLDLFKAASPPPYNTINRSVINDLNMINEQFIMVFDDYHYIHEKDIHNLISQILSHPPKGFHLVILTRKDPHLPINRLRARGMINEISSQDLRFTASETAEFISKKIDSLLNRKIIDFIDEKMEGWPAGLRLLAYSFKHTKNPDSFLDDLKGDFPSIIDYLLNEVLSQQEPQIVSSLIKTSILNRFCADLVYELCDETEINYGQIFIDWLIDNNLFINNLDSSKKWFRYHHLFSQALKRQLKKQFNPESVLNLHNKSGEWFEKNNLIEEALYHYLKAKNTEKVIDIVKQNRQRAINTDKWYLTSKWLTMIPEEIIKKSIVLLLTKVWVYYMQLRNAEISSIIKYIDSHLNNETIDQELLGEINFFKGMLLYWQGFGKKSLEYIRKAETQIPIKYDHMKGEIEIYLGFSQLCTGNKEQAINELNKKLDNCPDKKSIYFFRLIGAKIFIYMLSGELQKVLSLSLKLDNSAKERDYIFTELWVYYIKSYVYFNSCNFEKAIEYMSFIEKNKYIMHTKVSLYAMAGLALSYQMSKKTKEADDTLIELYDYAYESDNPDNLSVADSCKARVLLLRGDLNYPLKWLQFFNDEINIPSMTLCIEAPNITRCRILIAEGSNKYLSEALDIIEVMLNGTIEFHNTSQTIEVMVLKVLCLDKLSRKSEAIEFLEKLIHLSEPGGWIRPFVEAGDQMKILLEELQRKKCSIHYIERILTFFGEVSSEAASQPTDSKIQTDEKFSSRLQFKLLTSREFEILTLLAKNFSNREIAEKLFVSAHTVKTHLKNLYKKLNVNSRRKAVALTIEMGILPSE